MNRDDRTVFLHAGIIAFLIVMAAAAFAHPHVDCEMVRDQVRTHGKIKAYAWAISQGYSPKEISRIRKACGV